MPARQKTTPTKAYRDGGIPSGSLHESIRDHAKQRMLHFFSYLAFSRMLSVRFAMLYSTVLDSGKIIKAAATEQADTGFREKQQGRPIFDKTNPSLMGTPATSFDRMDAAHFCNLGIVSQIKQACLNSNDPLLVNLVQRLQSFAGDTKWLPQRINIGPDRVIDQLHHRLALDFWSKPIKWDQFKTYLEEAKKALSKYMNQQSGYPLLEEACEAYIEFYSQAMTRRAVLTPAIRRTLIRKRRKNGLPVTAELLHTKTADHHGERLCAHLTGSLRAELSELVAIGISTCVATQAAKDTQLSQLRLEISKLLP
ncbi:MAG: hypothetical protein AAFU85_30320 [Planctomycetota bacterium]